MCYRCKGRLSRLTRFGLRVQAGGFYDGSMKRAAFLSAPLLVVALVGCGGDSQRPSAAAPGVTESPIDVRGTITQITTVGPDVSLSGMAIEGQLERDTRYAKAWVRISDSTHIRRRQGEATEATTDLQVGMRVEVKFSGAVAQLDPVQATAADITIID
jgi:hypothetical protein